MIGHVLWFDYVKGYGFIRKHESKNNDAFVHCSEIKANNSTRTFLAGDQPVRYNIKQDKNGKPKAVNVEPLTIDDILLEYNLNGEQEKCFNPVLKGKLQTK